MIISHKHRFIFFAVPKTATHAVRGALRNSLDSGDWEQQVLLGKQALPIPEIAKIGHGHISATEIKPHLSDEIWASYFKFGFVRNPFDRYISTCFFLNRGNPSFTNNAVPYIKNALTVPRFRQRVLVKPQHQQLQNDVGEIELDYVGRCENLQTSYDELREIVARFYANDLAIFNYKFPGQ